MGIPRWMRKRKGVQRLVSNAFAMLARAQSAFDFGYLIDGVPEGGKQDWKVLSAELAAKPGLNILEIGSREVTGPSRDREIFKSSRYVGFDFYPGKNVDVVGDVHRLSSYFPPNEKFDVIYTSACFEHFAMPWIVAVEISKMLKVGGFLFVATHFSIGTHERPWNFFQFSDMGLKVLFPPALGFECINASLSDPIVGRFSKFADKRLRYREAVGLYSGSEYLGKKVREVESFDWNQISVPEIVNGTVYPSPKN
jgi:SAM-dependent methyltransferase